MKYSTLSPQCLRAIQQSGWYEGRKADLTSAVEETRKRSLEIYTNVLDFLFDFHGLEIPKNGSGIQFDVPLAFSRFSPSGVRELGHLTKKSLSLVGSCSSAVVLMSDFDELILLDDQWIGFTISKTREEFLLAITGCESGRGEMYVFDEVTELPVRVNGIGKSTSYG